MKTILVLSILVSVMALPALGQTPQRAVEAEIAAINCRKLNNLGPGLFSFRSIIGLSTFLNFLFQVPVRFQTAPTGPGCPKLDEKTEN